MRRPLSTGRVVARRRLLVVVTALRSAVAADRDAPAGYQRISGEGSSWAANAIDAMRVNVKPVRHHRRLQPQRLDAGSQELPQRHRRLRGFRHPVPVPARRRFGAREPGAGQLRLHPGHRRRHGVHVQPADQRQAGDQPAPVGRERHQDLHRRHHELERPGHPGRQPRSRDAGRDDRAGGALRRLGLQRAVHQVDDRAAPGSVERLLPAVGPCAGLRLTRRSTRPSPG